jgi:hypothetical protein
MALDFVANLSFPLMGSRYVPCVFLFSSTYCLSILFAYSEISESTSRMCPVFDVEGPVGVSGHNITENGLRIVLIKCE